MKIFSWATIGLGDRLAAKSDPPPPRLPLSDIITQFARSNCVPVNY